MEEDWNKRKHKKDELDEYIRNHSLRLHPAQHKLREITMSLEMWYMIASEQGMQLQQNLFQLIGGKKALEIGTYTGYGAMSIALVLPPNGRVVACDISEEYIQIGQPVWKEADVEEKIDVRIGPATETLRKLVEAGEAGTFDYAFIDADKINYDQYYELSLQLVRSGGLVIIDNTLWGSKVLLSDAEADEDTKSIKALNKKIHSDDRVKVSMLTVGDGLTICFKQ